MLRRLITDKRSAVSLAVLAAGIFFIAAGIALGDPVKVYTYAIVICLSCMGIG